MIEHHARLRDGVDIGRAELRPVKSDIGKTQIVGPVAKLSETPGTIRSMSPSLGQHTAEVLREFQMLYPTVQLRLFVEALGAIAAMVAAVQ